MRNLILILFTAVSLSVSAQWTTIPLVDEFGDEIDQIEAYLGDGRFSNSATTGDDLFVKVIPKGNIWDTPENRRVTSSIEAWTRYYDSLSSDWKPSTRKYAMKPSRLEKSRQDRITDMNNYFGSVKFVLYEYRSSPAGFRNWENIYISVKLSDGTVLKYTDEGYTSQFIPASIDDYVFIHGDKGTPAGRIVEAVMKGDIKVSIIQGSSRYNFYIPSNQ